MILGLDISTSITGYTILDYHGKIIRCGAWDMRNKKKFDNFVKTDEVKFITSNLMCVRTYSTKFQNTKLYSSAFPKLFRNEFNFFVAK